MKGISLPVLLTFFIRTFRRKFTVAIAVIFCTFFNDLCAQSPNELKSIIDSTKAEDLDSLYFSYFISNYVDEELNITNLDSAFRYVSLANEFANTYGDTVIKLRSEYALAFIYKERFNFNDAIKRYRNAMNLAEENPSAAYSRTTYLRSLNGLGLAYYYSGRLNEAVTYLLMSLEEKQKEGEDYYAISVTENNLGLVFYQLERYDRARRYFEDAMQNRLLSEFPDEIEDFFVNIGLSILGIAESIENEDRQADLIEEAKSNLRRAISLCESEDNNCSSYVTYEAYNGLGLIYMKYEDLGSQDIERDVAYDSSMLMYNKAMELANESPQPYNAIKTLINLSILHRSMNQYERAMYYSRKALSLAENRSDEVQNTLDNPTTLPQANTNLIQLKEINRELSFIHKQMGSMDSAYIYLEAYNDYKDLVFSTSISSTLENWASNIISEQDNTITEQDNTIEAGRRRNAVIVIASTSVIVLTSLFVIILYRSNKLRKKANDSLLLANKTIEEKNNELQNVNSLLEHKVQERTKELNTLNEALRQSNTELDNFIYKTSHDIRGPLATLQGICNVALLDVKDEKSIDYFEKLNGTATKLNEILSKLLIINQINNSRASCENVNIEEVVQQIIRSNLDKSRDKHIDTRINIDKSIKYRGDEDLIRIIIGNLVNNAYKFYKKSFSVESFVQINVFKNNLNLCIEIIDNGVGVEQDSQHKIFEIFSKATEMSDSAGLGLYLAKLSVEKLGGKIQLKKTAEGFTKFDVNLPFQKN